MNVIQPVITLSTSGHQLPCDDTQPTLLAVLEAHNVSVEFQCRQGYCGACRIGLVKGEVSYLHQPLACLAEGDILPCCCRANGNIELAL